MNTEVRPARHHEKRKFLLLQLHQKLLKSQPNQRMGTNQMMIMMTILRKTLVQGAQKPKKRRKKPRATMTGAWTMIGVSLHLELIKRVMPHLKHRKRRKKRKRCEESYSLGVLVVPMMS